MSSCLKEPQVEQFVDISNVFEINLHQSLGEFRTALVQLDILEDQQCEDVKIISNLLETSQDVILEISAIEIPNNCNSGINHINKQHELTKLSGNYNFVVNLAEAEANTGQITISQNDVQIEFQNLEGISANHLSLRMIEDNFLWGYFENKDQLYSLDEIKNLLFSVNPELALNPTKSPAYYGFFEIFEDQRIELSEEKNAKNTFYAHYNPSDWQAFKIALDQLLQEDEYSDAIVRIYNERGEILTN